MSDIDLGIVAGLYLLCWATGYGFGVSFYTVKKILEGSGAGV